MMKKMDKKAFTLIELLVVIAVVGILVLLAAPRFTGYTQKAERARIQHDTKVMEEEVGTVLINGDDDFNKWENNSKDYLNQLAQDNELFEKEGLVANDKPIDGNYKIIPEKYKGKINTKLKGTFYANIDGKVYYEHGKGPGYSDEEIEDLIAEGFIPIAWAEDLNSIRSTKKRIYAAGTKWETPVEVEGGLDKKYIQVQNVVDLTDLSEYSEEGWEPIGRGVGFTGIYDGGNYVITNLEVQSEDEDNQGLFGYANGATIRNVGLIDNKVTGSGDYLGGLVGRAENRTEISNSYATGSVTGTQTVGGLVGGASSSTIINSYATGLVTGGGSFWVSDYSGGLVGEASGGTKISNSYFTGSVTGVDHVGGLVGEAWTSTIESSYVTGSVTGTDIGTEPGLRTGKRIGGLVGRAYGGTISNSYVTGPVKGRESVGGLVGYAWGITINNSYATGHVTGTSWEVGGLVGHAERRNEIINSYFTGSVTGGSDVGGLVGEVDNQQTNSTEHTTISNSYTTGSVTGLAGSYHGSGDNVGGLVGVVNRRGIEISNSYATGEVTGRYQVGGLVGRVKKGSSTINKSYFEGLVTSTSGYSGGLVGYSVSTVTISNSYSTGSVTGSGFFAGGLVGGAESSANVKINNSYSTGLVERTGNNAGGLVGGKGNNATVTVTNSYWDTETTGQTNSTGANSTGIGGTGLTANEMKNQATYPDGDSGWDFANVWEITPGNYPTLR